MNAGFHVPLFRFGIDLLRDEYRRDGNVKAEAEKIAHLAAKHPAQDQDGERYSVFPERNPLLKKTYAEIIAPESGDGVRDLRHSMAVRVRLHNCHDLDAVSNTLSDPIEIIFQCRQIYLSSRASHSFDQGS